MTKKEMAVSFLKMAGSGDVRAAYAKFIAPNFIHHNQYFKGDRQSLMEAMEEASKHSPNKSIEVKHNSVPSDPKTGQSLMNLMPGTSTH